jgi:thiol-disulfide isomerase/thioredoxin
LQKAKNNYTLIFVSLKNKYLTMKYALTLVFATLLLIGSSFAQHNIELKINGLKAGDECILAHYYADQNKIVDTLVVSKTGRVVKKGPNTLLNGVYIVVLPNRSYMEFVVPENDQIFILEFDTTLASASKKVTGSDDNAAFFAFDLFASIKGTEMRKLKEDFGGAKDEASKASLKKQIAALDKEVDAKRRSLIAEYPTTFTAKLFRSVLEIEIPESLTGDTTGKRFLYYRAHYWDNIDLTDDGLLRTPVYKGKLEYFFINLYVQTPDSIIPAIDYMAERLSGPTSKELYKYTIWWATNHFEESKLMCMDKVLHHMAKNYYCAGKCWWADTSLVNKMCEHAGKIGTTVCGAIAPDMILVDTAFKRNYQLSKINSPVTVLVFWDHQCGHCKKELPKLKLMYDSLKSKGVEVYAVYTQGDWEGWKTYVKENKLNWINVMDAYNKATYRKDYNIISTPQVYLLDENKEIKFKNPPAENVGRIAEIMLEEYKQKQEKLKTTPKEEFNDASPMDLGGH